MNSFIRSHSFNLIFVLVSPISWAFLFGCETQDSINVPLESTSPLMPSANHASLDQLDANETQNQGAPFGSECTQPAACESLICFASVEDSIGMCTLNCSEDQSVCPQGTLCQNYTGFGSICVYPEEPMMNPDMNPEAEMDSDMGMNSPSIDFMMEDVAECGNGELEANESCDDGNLITETCEYGQVSCLVCNDQCQEIEQTGMYCGDGVINGDERCDGESWCSTECEGNAPPCSFSGTGCPEIEWVSIDGGSFEMGSTERSHEQPIHTVNVPTFEIMRTEVTVAQYRICVDAGVCSPPNIEGYGDNHPVIYVDWEQSRTFAQWVGGDLPSEAQWEYAARGGDGNLYTYAGSNNIDDVAWYRDNSNNSTQPVGQKDANGFGLHDLSGNVFEWTLDEYESSYTGAPTDGSPRCSNSDCTGSSRRVRRGGCWECLASNARVATRQREVPSTSDNLFGFRVVRVKRNQSNIEKRKK